jgi:glycosyltransferase involved in cell wall biosynthesis
MKVSIIIPAHNEEKRIGKTLRAYLKYFKKIGNFEILVVLNGCEDGTLNIVEEIKKDNPEIRYIEFKRAGKGFAIREGFKDALKRENGLIGFIDADLSSPPKSFHYLIKNIDKWDGSIANRWDRRSKFDYSLFKKIRSKIYNLFVRFLFLFPYPDTQCGCKVFRRRILEGNLKKIVSSDFNFDVALLFCLKKEENARIKSLPTKWLDRTGSKIFSIKSPIRMFLSAIRLRLVHSPFEFIVKFYRKIVPENLKLDKILK